MSEHIDVAVGLNGTVARIRHIMPDGGTIFFSLQNGNTGSATSETRFEGIAAGDVVLVANDQLVKIPSEVWPEESWVGVVRLLLPDVTVVDAGGRWQLLPTTDVPCGVGNTVEASPSGVQRVLQKSPIRLLDVVDLDSSVVDRFRSEPDVTTGSYDELGGLETVLMRAKELIELPMLHRDKLKAIGARPVKGVLLTGPPGTGKTMLARIIASRSGATFYDVKGPEIFSKWYGQSEELLRLIFEDAKTKDRAIIFFDEIDSVASQRNQDAHESTRRVVAQLLTLLDGFEPDENTVVLATTNRPEDLDAALRRPGRLDWEIEFPLPTVSGRRDILEKSAAGKKVVGTLPFDTVALGTEGWSGAELVAIWTEAALLAVSDDRESLLTEDFLGGWQRVAALRTTHAQTMVTGIA